MKEIIIGEKSLESLLAETSTATGGDDPGKTVDELCEELGLSERAVRGRLKILQASGRLAVGRRSVMRIDGIIARVPVYRIVAAIREKQRKR